MDDDRHRPKLIRRRVPRPLPADANGDAAHPRHLPGRADMYRLVGRRRYAGRVGAVHGREPVGFGVSRAIAASRHGSSRFGPPPIATLLRLHSAQAVKRECSRGIAHPPDSLQPRAADERYRVRVPLCFDIAITVVLPYVQIASIPSVCELSD
jgi:hypothetical protein